MPIGCVLFLFYYLCSEFLEIILKEMRGLAIIFRFFMLLVLLLPVVALCPACEGGNDLGRAYPYCHFL